MLYFNIIFLSVLARGSYIAAQDMDFSISTQYADIEFLFLKIQLDLQNHHESVSQKF